MENYKVTYWVAGDSGSFPTTKEFTSKEEAEQFASTIEAHSIEVYDENDKLIDQILPAGADLNPNAVPQLPVE